VAKAEAVEQVDKCLKAKRMNGLGMESVVEMDEQRLDEEQDFGKRQKNLIQRDQV